LPKKGYSSVFAGETERYFSPPMHPVSPKWVPGVPTVGGPQTRHGELGRNGRFMAGYYAQKETTAI